MSYSKKPLVGIIMGSSSDSKIMKEAATVLNEFQVKHEDQIVSAHRTPTRLSDYAKHAEKNGFKVIIAGAGGSAHLPGMIASHTIIPVIGVPIMVYNDKSGNSDRFKFSAFGGLTVIHIRDANRFASCNCRSKQGYKCRTICSKNTC